MRDENIKWARRLWTINDFPQNIQHLLRELGVGRPLLIERVNGDGMYVRRINTYAFQCGVCGDSALGEVSND